MATYQTNVAPISDTLAHHKAWANTYGGGFSTAGWSAQTGHGEVVASGTGASYAWTDTGSVHTTPTTALVPVRNYRFNGAFVPSATYTGANTADSTTTTDLVTYSTGGNTAITYVHITATSSLATVPPSDTTNWQPFIYEIWKSNGSNTSSLPIFVRIVYTIASTGNTGPRVLIQFGTGVDANGQLTGAPVITAVAPTSVRILDNAAAGNATAFDCDFAGDADNIRWIWQRGNTNTGYTNMFVIDRAKTGSGTDSDAFFFIGSISPSASTYITQSVVVPKPALGQPLTRSAIGWIGQVSNGSQTGTSAAFGTTPPYPCFPMIGYMANPLLGYMGFASADVTDGQLLPVWVYGASHTYLVNSVNIGTAAYSPQNIANGVCASILWE